MVFSDYTTTASVLTCETYENSTCGISFVPFSSSEISIKTPGPSITSGLSTSSLPTIRVKISRINSTNYGGAPSCTTCNTLTVFNNFDCSNYYYPPPPEISPASRLKKIIKARSVGLILNPRNNLPSMDDREQRARETLKLIIGESKYKSFLKNGFVSIQGKSGKIYQIFPGHKITKVFDCGKLAEKLCVVLRGNFPPTDSLIMRYLLILNDENEFRKFAISHSVYAENRLTVKKEQSTLVEIFKQLKLAS